jgi:epoxyqueuosine reductase
MSLKEDIREKALELGFEAAGFTGVEPLDLYIEEIRSRPEMYAWADNDFFSLSRGASPGVKHPWARSLVVLVRNYYTRRFPDELVGLFGRAYQVDERKVRGEEAARLLAFLGFLRGEGVEARFDEEVPARMTAARAGVVTYGKNCFVFAGNSMKGSSWLESIPLLLDADIEPDQPSIQLDCPPNCKDRCIEACPTGAIYEPLRMNPLKCIAFNTYYGAELTPIELREPMGTWVYGCDACQVACPRNLPWMKRELPANPDLESRAGDYRLATLLEMDEAYYVEKVWPRFFYMSRKSVDRWQMNAARALGNLRDADSVPLLEKSLAESPHPNVRAMSAWALGRVGGARARSALEGRLPVDVEPVASEIRGALEYL